MIRFACCRCGKQYRKDVSLAGRLGKCSCGYVFRVPGMNVSPAGDSFSIVLDDDLQLAARPNEAHAASRKANIAVASAGGLLIMLLFSFRGAIVAHLPDLAPATVNSELSRKIYECYNTQSMRRGADGGWHPETPAKITILSVERREKGDPRWEGTPHYAKVRVRFKDGTTRENDEWAFFVQADGNVWYESWGGLAWRNFMLDAAEGKLPASKPKKPVKP